MKYGILFKDNLQSPWTLLGSAFSHQNFVFRNVSYQISFGTHMSPAAGHPGVRRWYQDIRTKFHFQICTTRR